MVPLGARHDGHAGRYGSKLPAYSSASTTNASPRPSGPWPAVPPVIEPGIRAPTNAEGSAPDGDQDVDQPARRRALAVRAGDADERPPDGRVGDDLLPRLERDPGGPRRGEFWLVGIDRGQRLGHGQPLRAREARHMRCRMLPGQDDPERLERRGVGRRAAGIAAGHGRARAGRQDRGRARARAGGADHVDPLPWPGSVVPPGPAGDRPRPGPGRRQRRASARLEGGRPGSRGARARPRRSVACSRSDRPSRRSAARRRRGHRRRRRT